MMTEEELKIYWPSIEVVDSVNYGLSIDTDSNNMRIVHNHLLSYCTYGVGRGRACMEWPTVSIFNNGAGGYYKRGEEVKAEEDYEICRKSYIDREISFPIYNGLHAAYFSMIVLFGRKPNNDFLNLFKKRALEYCRNYKGLAYKENSIKIKGFRLIEFTEYQV